jgi:hypothetical protein
MKVAIKQKTATLPALNQNRKWTQHDVLRLKAVEGSGVVWGTYKDAQHDGMTFAYPNTWEICPPILRNDRYEVVVRTGHALGKGHLRSSAEVGFGLVAFKEKVSERHYYDYAVPQLVQAGVSNGGTLKKPVTMEKFAGRDCATAVTTFRQKDGTTSRVESYFVWRNDGLGGVVVNIFNSDLAAYETYKPVLTRILESITLPSLLGPFQFELDP